MLIRAADLDTSAPEWLADGMIPRVGVGFVYGKSYWGKSLMVDGELALAVANGTPFFNNATIQGDVIVCLGEGLYDAGARKQARLAREQQDRLDFAAQIAVGVGEDAAKAWLDEQPPYTDDHLLIWPDRFTIPFTRIGSDGEGEPTRSLQRFINAASRMKDLELVVIDAISDFTGGLSISNDTSANRLMLGMKEISRQLNCCVIAVAHPTADDKKMLGAGRLFNAADFVIKIEPDENNAPGNPQSVAVISEKNKYGPKFAPTGYIIEPCQWMEPVLDYQGNQTGEMALIKSATIRQNDDDVQGAPVLSKRVAKQIKRDLPKLMPADDGRRKKRSGIKRLFSPVG
jgi:AAA domain